VHTVLGVSNVLLVLLASFLALHLLKRFGRWSVHRSVPLLVLAMPLTGLALGLEELHHLLDRPCFLGAPTWDQVLGTALLLGMGAIAVGGFGFGLARLVLLRWVLSRKGTWADPVLQALVARLAERRGTTVPRIRLYPYDRPVAFTYGWWRPVIFLSTWMVEHLDHEEREAVLAHEVEHVARRDYFVMALAIALRDAFWYVPTSWTVYRQLQHEKELTCDEWASHLTNRPLALASALAKVWQHSAEGVGFGAAQTLAGPGEALEGRIERLLEQPAPVPTSARNRPALLAAGAFVVVLLALVAVSGTLILAAMGCGPALTLWRLF
jgi:Zn-dependent protease with chaperone function